MTKNEFKKNLKLGFESHRLMRDRKWHTVNEMLYILEHRNEFKNMDFNISIKTLTGEFWTIPSIDCFVTVALRGVKFIDADVDFEVENINDCELDDNNYDVNCITIYECKGE